MSMKGDAMLKSDLELFAQYDLGFIEEPVITVIDDEYIEKVLIKNIKNALVYIQKQVNLIKQNQQIEEAPF